MTRSSVTIDPLPSQRAFADQVVARCRRPDPTGFKLVPISGRWGDGKSYMLSLIEGDLLSHGIGVVRLNVWQSEADSTFYESIVRSVYGTTGFMRHLGWLRHPIGLTLATSLRWRPTLLKLGVSSTSAEVTLRHLPPTLPYVAALSRDLRARHRKGAPSLVLIVDEIDRATPVAAQTVLTVLRRAFDVPGVVVLMSFVEEHVHFNTFNPERGMLDDLRGAFMSIVSQERAFETATDAGLGATPPTPPEGSVARIRASDLLSQLGTIEPDKDVPTEQRLRAADRVQGLLSIDNDLELLDHYVRWSEAKKVSVQRRAAEKFLHGGAMRMPQLTPEDVGALVLRADGYREAMKSLAVPGPGGSPVTEDDVVTAITTTVAAITSRSPLADDDDAPPPIRHLKSTIDEFLPILATAAAQQPAGLEARHLGAAVAALYRAAQLKAGA